MKKTLMLMSLVLTLLKITNAQTAEDSVKVAVNQLFEGMKNSDASMIRNAFADSAILQSVGRNKDGKTVVQNENIDDFAKMISDIKKG
ncbi:MAG TPA: hypothetical protein VGG71_01575, partial [Chitinophagaceae bacterium]